jgi:hypothetical protein
MPWNSSPELPRKFPTNGGRRFAATGTTHTGPAQRETRPAAQKLITIDKVDVILTRWSEDAEVVAPIAEMHAWRRRPAPVGSWPPNPNTMVLLDRSSWWRPRSAPDYFDGSGRRKVHGLLNTAPEVLHCLKGGQRKI